MKNLFLKVALKRTKPVDILKNFLISNQPRLAELQFKFRSRPLLKDLNRVKGADLLKEFLMKNKK
jgi:hypothetical protein